MKKQAISNNTGILLANSLQGEQVRVLYSQLPVSILSSTLLATILIAVQKAVIDPTTLFIWAIILAVTLLARLIQFITWKRYYDPANMSHWLLIFRISILTIGIVWAFGGILLSADENITYTLYVSFTLAGLCAGASSTLAIDRISTMSFLLPIQISQFIFHIAQGDSVSLGMGALWILYLFFLISNSQQIMLKLKESFFLRAKAFKSESRLFKILESSPIATRIATVDSNQVVFANSRYSELLELPPEQIIGITPANFYANPDEYKEVVERISKGENIVNMLIELRSIDEQNWSKWVLASYFSMEYFDEPTVLGWFYDITERKLLEDEIEYRATHDTLTGLANRSLYNSLLNQLIATAEREQNILAIMFIDLDKFKPVNDDYGHQVGDWLLKAVAERIVSCLRQSDSAARVGGDEFVVLLSNVKTESNALMIAENIRDKLNRPFEIHGLTLNISSSIGVSIYPDQADSAKQLIELADTAMYYAKSAGRNLALVYRPEMKN